MCCWKPALLKQVLPVVVGLTAMLAFASWAGTAQAGILLPEQVGFDAKDLERSLSDEGAGSSRSSKNETPSWPSDNDDQQRTPLGLLKSSLPTSSSSSSSSSSGSGAVGSGVVLCIFNSTITIDDDAPLSRLAESHGLSLPDPPGTDLLRPPRS